MFESAIAHSQSAIQQVIPKIIQAIGISEVLLGLYLGMKGSMTGEFLLLGLGVLIFFVGRKLER